ncbi:Hypothetical predicted protein [Pelobates cultripes]|uniref:Uncharacterized protein n=1 Tax=Pelobates cultripes TaxID=61616 RepID=A0AAD1VR30_PELCU|nr:Hypothetical predicted protein [Pelobates cultripes]
MTGLTLEGFGMKHNILWRHNGHPPALTETWLGKELSLMWGGVASLRDVTSASRIEDTAVLQAVPLATNYTNYKQAMSVRLPGLEAGYVKRYYAQRRFCQP